LSPLILCAGACFFLLCVDGSGLCAAAWPLWPVGFVACEGCLFSSVV
jgi:hypothetical protein